MKLCKHCNSEIPKARAKRSNVLYCSDQCGKIARGENISTKDINNVSRPITGAIAEQLVTIDLLSKGWYVFTAVYGASPVDLMAYKDNIVLKIQVKSAFMYNNGTLRLSPLHNHDHNILATVVHNKDNTIFYLPTLDSFTE